jgi:hypothetical protein
MTILQTIWMSVIEKGPEMTYYRYSVFGIGDKEWYNVIGDTIAVFFPLLTGLNSDFPRVNCFLWWKRKTHHLPPSSRLQSTYLFELGWHKRRDFVLRSAVLVSSQSLNPCPASSNTTASDSDFSWKVDQKEILLFIIRVKREIKRVYRNGCRYNERLNTETGGSKTPRTHWVAWVNI